MARFRISVSVVMLHPTTGLPLVETGREGHREITETTLDQGLPDTSAEEVFLALVHHGGEALWPQAKKLIDGTKTPPPR